MVQFFRNITPQVVIMTFILIGCMKAVHAESCAKTMGEKAAKQLVDRCINVSPATHPPCNALNACELIIDEIKHGCSFATVVKPKYCAEYK